MTTPITDADHLLVVDLEATCWKGTPPPGEINEIIEVGVCILALDSGKISDKRSILVRPTRSKLSAFCTELTTLTQTQVDQGVSFRAACDILKRDYLSETRVWSSWGSFDQRMFYQQCQLFDEPYPFNSTHVNLKKVYSKGRRLKHRPGMREALDQLGLELEGTHHRGADDAYNIARIAAHLLRDLGRAALVGKIT